MSVIWNKTVSNKNQCLSYRIKPFQIKINVCHIEIIQLIYGANQLTGFVKGKTGVKLIKELV